MALAANTPDALRDYARMVDAIHFLDAHAGDAPDLAAAADAMGLSPHHAQRVFTRWAGVSPKRFLQAAAASRARAHLEDAATVLDATYDAGLSSPGRLHDLMVSIEAMTPGDVRRRGAGLTIRWGRHATPFGLAEVGVTDCGICSLVFVDADTEPSTGPAAHADWPAAHWVHDPRAGAEVAALLAGGDAAPTSPLAVLVRGTNLQVQVWRALLRIPEGRVTSYGALASALGRQGAPRAVASAIAANRVGWLIPCHRVLRATGAVSGYRWGPERKRLMLAREEARTSPGA